MSTMKKVTLTQTTPNIMAQHPMSEKVASLLSRFHPGKKIGGRGVTQTVFTRKNVITSLKLIMLKREAL